MSAPAQPTQALTAARVQRDQALACALLFLCLLLAMLWSNYGPEPRQIIHARTAILEHRMLLVRHQEILRANEQALVQTKAELKRLRQAAPAPSP